MIQILVAILPLAQVFLLRALRNVVFIRGAAVGVTETVVSAFVLLLPYCLVAGYALTLACSILAREEGPAGIGRAYVADSIGSIVGRRPVQLCARPVPRSHRHARLSGAVESGVAVRRSGRFRRLRGSRRSVAMPIRWP